jgi:uncharacterized protein (DUF2141 family)
MNFRPACLVTLLLAAAPAFAATCATVELRNVRPGQGFVMLAAYGDAASFGKTAMSSLRVPAGEAVMKIEMCGLSGSQVAITSFQDLDSDGKMGRNLLGMPTEPWGASGTPGAFGPSWETTAVALDGKAISVSLSQ